MAKPLDDKPQAPPQPKAPSHVDPGQLFRDKVYTSRTLILPSGNPLPVARGRVIAVSDEQLQYLSAHPDFERLTE